MPKFVLTHSQKAQLVSWLNREKDYLLSCRSIAQQILTPRVTGTLELISNDLDFVTRVREEVKDEDPSLGPMPVLLSDDDIQAIIDIGHANTYPKLQSFWNEIIEVLGAV